MRLPHLNLIGDMPLFDCPLCQRRGQPLDESRLAMIGGRPTPVCTACWRGLPAEDELSGPDASQRRAA